MTRARVLDEAAKLIGNYGKGSPELYAICRDVCPLHWTDAQCRQYAATKEWCGLFSLHALRNAEVTTAHWVDGLGFLGPLHLKRVPWPKPGDIAYKADPFQHHMIVEYWNHDNDWGDIAGNTPFAARHRHASSLGVAFYSIASLLGEHDTEPAPPPSKPARRVLKLGSTGPDVAELQAKLNGHGAQLKPDGVFGPMTMNAVMSFQRRAGLSPDGVVGALTWGALEQV